MPSRHEIADVPARKLCPRCQRELYLSNFEEDKSQPDNLTKICANCRAETEKEAFHQQLNEAVTRIDKSSLELLNRIAAAPGKSSLVTATHAATLLQDIMGVWGGSQAFAEHMFKEYLVAPPGGQARQKYLTAVINLIKFVSEQNYVNQPLETMSDEQIAERQQQKRRELMDRLRISEGTVDGSVNRTG
jgi:hypothetical protein